MSSSSSLLASAFRFASRAAVHFATTRFTSSIAGSAERVFSFALEVAPLFRVPFSCATLTCALVSAASPLPVSQREGELRNCTPYPKPGTAELVTELRNWPRNWPRNCGTGREELRDIHGTFPLRCGGSLAGGGLPWVCKPAHGRMRNYTPQAAEELRNWSRNLPLVNCGTGRGTAELVVELAEELRNWPWNWSGNCGTRLGVVCGTGRGTASYLPSEQK